MCSVMSCWVPWCVIVCSLCLTCIHCASINFLAFCYNFAVCSWCVRYVFAMSRCVSLCLAVRFAVWFAACFAGFLLCASLYVSTCVSHWCCLSLAVFCYAFAVCSQCSVVSEHVHLVLLCLADVRSIWKRNKIKVACMKAQISNEAANSIKHCIYSSRDDSRLECELERQVQKME